MRFLTYLTAFLSCLLRCMGAEPDLPPYPVADIYKDLRGAVLSLKPGDVGESDHSKILAVLMDTGLPEAAYTLVATIDGSASLYFSNGGGIIGAGEHAAGAEASKALLEEAAKHLASMKPTERTPFVAPGMTTFYAVTGKQILTLTAKTEDLGEGRHPASRLFHTAHELISRIKTIDESRTKKP
ncbi:MAG TPA: hypothetical protein VD994_18555 [Prosthecobacter sp.]|nr:hypothetical protein [Prosthecobacter sp.]